MAEKSDTAERIDALPIPGKPEEASGEAPKAKKERTALAEQKAAFTRLLSEQKQERKATKERRLEKEGEPEKESAPPKEEAAKVEPAKAPEKSAASPEVEKMRARLLLAGTPKKAMETLSDEDVREWWKAQEKRESDAALAHQRASVAEKQLEALRGTTGKKAEQVPTASPDLEELASKLADQFGEDEAGTLLDALKVLVEPLHREVTETRQLLAEARDRGLKDIGQKNRERLAAKLPSLRESDKAWETIQAAALERSKKDPSRYSSADAVFDEVFQDLYGSLIEERAAAPAPERDEAKEKARISASLPTPPSATKREKRLTPMDAAFSAFKVLRKNPDDLEGARRAYGQAQLPQ